MPDALTPAQAQASLDVFCVRTADSRPRHQDGQRTTVGALAELEPVAPLPPPFPATLNVTRIVTAQALVAFRGNRYSVPPGLAGTVVTVSHRLGSPTLDIATGTTVLARHRRQPDGAGSWSATPGTSARSRPRCLARSTPAGPAPARSADLPAPPHSRMPSSCSTLT